MDKKKASDSEASSKLQEAKSAPEHEPPIVGAGPQKPLTGDQMDKKADGTIEVPQMLPSEKPISGKAPSDNRPAGDKPGDKPIAGRKTMKGIDGKRPSSDKPSDNVANQAASEASQNPSENTEKTESKEEHEVETEFNSILKKGPSKLHSFDSHWYNLTLSVIIFSKSYCPFSAKAKRILLEKYTIVPAPHVVELDQHPLGTKLQASLETMTGRRTVPNIMINGKSIGGGDDVEELDNASTLIDKIKGMGGKRVMEVKLREVKE